METLTLDQIKDEFLGKKGTDKRDKYEAQLAEETKLPEIQSKEED